MPFYNFAKVSLCVFKVRISVQRKQIITLFLGWLTWVLTNVMPWRSQSSSIFSSSSKIWVHWEHSSSWSTRNKSAYYVVYGKYLQNGQYKALSTLANQTCKQTSNAMRTCCKRFIWTSENRAMNLTCNVWSTIRHKPNLVSFLANTKGICNDVWSTVLTVHSVWMGEWIIACM